MKTQEYTVVGTRPIRHDGADKVTGRAQYGADFQMAGLLHGHILRSPHAHSRIRSIDTSKAAKLASGVRAANQMNVQKAAVALAETVSRGADESRGNHHRESAIAAPAMASRSSAARPARAR